MVSGPFGSNIGKRFFVESGVPVIRGNNLSLGMSRFKDDGFVYLTEDKAEEFKNCEAHPGDLLFTAAGTIGQVGIIPPKGRYLKYIISNKQLRARLNSQVIDPLFAYYWFASPDMVTAIQSRNTGSTIPLINLSVIKSLRMPVPPLGEQQQIVAHLSLIDDRITLLRETNATLEAIAQALFKSWFVDFDPVHAKQQGIAPEGMDDATAALFPDSFEESELGLVPRGWRVATLADTYEINPHRKLKKGELAPYLDMANVPTAGHCAESIVQREMVSGSKFQNGDTLLARITPCLENGKSAFVDFLGDGETGWGSTEFVVLRTKSPLPDFHAYLLCRHAAFREFAVQSMSGTSGRQRIQNDVLGRYLLAVPTELVALAFAGIVAPIQRKITANHAQAQTLATLRDTLLPRLISGQLRLPEAKAFIEEVV